MAERSAADTAAIPGGQVVGCAYQVAGQAVAHPYQEGQVVACPYQEGGRCPGRWGGTCGARTGGLVVRKQLQARSQWPQRHLEARSTLLRRPRYFVAASCADTEPRSVVHPGRRLIGKLASHHDVELVGSDEQQSLCDQPVTDTRVSIRNGTHMACGGCAFTC